MKFCQAPMEGITGSVFRTTIHEVFGDAIDTYFTPFLTPHFKCFLSAKEEEDVHPDHNVGMHTVPQILTNSAEGFLTLTDGLHNEYAYEEVNLNLGCPSKTVTGKGRGSGFLAKPVELARFLDAVFEKSPCAVSVKTRIGDTDPEEFKDLLALFNRFPIRELIVHPRIRTEAYRGSAHREWFVYALQESRNPLCYNGDITSKEDFEEVKALFDKEGRDYNVMIGRGLIADPSLIRQLKGGSAMTPDELDRFLSLLLTRYRAVMPGEIPTLYKMKEVWSYMGRLFPDYQKAVKKLLKTRTISEYKIEEQTIIKNI